MSMMIVAALMFASPSDAVAANSVAAEPAPATSAQGSPTKAKKVKPKKTCRTDTMDTGSRIAKKVCKTDEEWQKEADGQEVRVKGRTSGV
jgi:hypothetical protein